MRYKPFLGSMNPKTKKMMIQRGRGMESGKYEWEWYDDPSRGPPVATLFLRVTHLLGNHVNHQGEMRQTV
jgi:cell fate regulator YaaT (PSP1 superfamily)